MEPTQWAEIAAMGFALAVLAWVIFRLTGSLVNIFKHFFPVPGDEPMSGDPVEEKPERPDDKGA